MFYSPASFDFVQSFEGHWQQIRDEYLGLDSALLEVHRNGSHEDYFAQIMAKNGWAPSWKLGSDEKNMDWLTYALSYHGHFPSEAASKYPVTMSILQKYPQIKVCAFSNMRPRSFIPQHSHAELGGNILTFHFGIDVTPGTSYLNVSGKFEEESNGKAIVFDGSAPHFAMNAGADDRVIMYMEFDQSV